MLLFALVSFGASAQVEENCYAVGADGVQETHVKIDCVNRRISVEFDDLINGGKTTLEGNIFATGLSGFSVKLDDYYWARTYPRSTFSNIAEEDCNEDGFYLADSFGYTDYISYAGEIEEILDKDPDAKFLVTENGTPLLNPNENVNYYIFQGAEFGEDFEGLSGCVKTQAIGLAPRPATYSYSDRGSIGGTKMKFTNTHLGNHMINFSYAGFHALLAGQIKKTPGTPHEEVVLAVLHENHVNPVDAPPIEPIEPIRPITIIEDWTDGYLNDGWVEKDDDDVEYSGAVRRTETKKISFQGGLRNAGDNPGITKTFDFSEYKDNVSAEMSFILKTGKYLDRSDTFTILIKDLETGEEKIVATFQPTRPSVTERIILDVTDYMNGSFSVTLNIEVGYKRNYIMASDIRVVLFP